MLYIYVCVYIIYKYIHIIIRNIYIEIYINIDIYVYIYIYLCVYVCTCIRVYVCTCVCVYTAIHMQKTTTGHLMTMHVMFSEFMRQRLCTLCFPNSCAKDYLTAGGRRECHSSAANEDGYDILWYRSGTLDRRTCLIMSFHFRDGMWLTQEPPCRLMIWTWFHLFIKDDGLRNSTRHVQPHRHCSSLPKINSVH